MKLKTFRLFIRDLREDDWTEMKRLFIDFNNSRYAVYDRPLPTEDMEVEALTKQFIENNLFFAVDRPIPTMLDYRTHIKKGSMFNTPPVLPIFSALQTLRYYKELGGIEALEKHDLAKAAKLYDAIDSSRMFVGTVTDPVDRSIMNVCFVMKPEYKELEEPFVEFCATKGIVGIKGHRSVGGFRASLYNALPMESVDVLVEAMKEFESKH